MADLKLRLGQNRIHEVMGPFILRAETVDGKIEGDIKIDFGPFGRNLDWNGRVWNKASKIELAKYMIKMAWNSTFIDIFQRDFH